MGSFFEELVEARRRGEVVEPEPADREEVGLPPVKVGFLPSRDVAGAVDCVRCGGLVGETAALLHVAWHQTIGV